MKFVNTILHCALCLLRTMSCLSWLPFDYAVCGDKRNCCYVRWKHSMCNSLGFKILQGPRPAAWEQKGLHFKTKKLRVAYWTIKKSHTPITIHHPMHLPTKTNVSSIYMPCSLIPRLFPPQVFDCLQYAKTEGEGLGESHA